MFESVINVSLQVLNNVIVSIDVKNGILEVTLELHSRPVHLGELGENLVLRRILLLLLRFVTVAIVVIEMIEVVVLMHDHLVSNSTDIQVVLLGLEPSCGQSFRVLMVSRGWSLMLLYFRRDLTFMLELDFSFSNFLLHRTVDIAVFARPFHSNDWELWAICGLLLSQGTCLHFSCSPYWGL